MTLRLAIAAAALLGAGCDDEPFECGPEHATASGVGRPCQHKDDCGERRDLRCPPLSDPTGIRFCTAPCDYGAPGSDECGEGATCAYLGAGGRCVPTVCADSLAHTPPTSEDTTVGRVNAQGVGQPCLRVEDCTGSAALLCERESREGGFDFCTADCAYSESDLVDNSGQCGDGTTCVYFGEGLGRCVPEADAERLAKEPPAPVAVTVPCCPGKVNEEGIGLRCTEHVDCAGNGEAHSCPAAIDPVLPNWCSHLCEFRDDEDCGPDAFCWWRPAVHAEDQGGMVGSCAPLVCKSDGDPPACD